MDTLINPDYLAEALRRVIPDDDADEFAAGVVADGYGSTCLTVRRGDKVVLHKEIPQDDDAEWAVKVLTPYKDRLKDVKVNGAIRTWLHLREKGYPVTTVLISEVASELCLRFQTRVVDGRLAGLTDYETINQLAALDGEVDWKKLKPRTSSLLLAFAPVKDKVPVPVQQVVPIPVPTPQVIEPVLVAPERKVRWLDRLFNLPTSVQTAVSMARSFASRTLHLFAAVVDGNRQ